MTKIIPILAGVGHCYLVTHVSGFFLVDTGSPGHFQSIARRIHSHGLDLRNLQFIFLTHTHYDHAGNAFLLQEASGAPIIVHESESGMLKQGTHPVPNGTNLVFKIISFLGQRFSKSHASFKAANPDIVFQTAYSAKDLGAEALIVHTPGHTLGSSSLIFEGNLFAGDSLFNVAGMVWPPFANDEARLLETWKYFDTPPITTCYPAHGKRMGKEVFSKALKKRGQKGRVKLNRAKLRGHSHGRLPTDLEM